MVFDQCENLKQTVEYICDNQGGAKVIIQHIDENNRNDMKKIVKEIDAIKLAKVKIVSISSNSVEMDMLPFADEVRFPDET